MKDTEKIKGKTRKGKETAECSEIGKKNTGKIGPNKLNKAQFQEGENVIEMTVNYEEQDAQFPDESEIIQDDMDEENSSSSEEEEDELDEVQFINNNAMRCDDSMADMTDGGTKNKKRVSAGQKRFLQEEEKREFIGEAIGCVKKCVEEMLSQSGIVETAQKLQEQLHKGTYETEERNKCTKTGNQDRIPIQVDSEITIYKNAITDRRNKQGSLSSEDDNWMVEVDTSDENMGIEKLNVNEDASKGTDDVTNQIMKFITDRRPDKNSREDDVQPSSSGWKPNTAPRDNSQHRKQVDMAEERANDLIREAEAAKDRIYNLEGREYSNKQIKDFQYDVENRFVHSAMVDENYLIVAAHVDEITQKKIQSGQYVDFARLIPRDRIQEEEDTTMQMVVKQGKTFWKPSSSYCNGTINNLNKWEQAFRVFLDIYTRSNPQRASELIQYNHIIHTTAATYVWDNVYLYDKDFRLHMSKFPTRSWGIILQQAWNL